MNKKIIKKSITEAKKIMRQIDDPAHDYEHARSVFLDALKILKRSELKVDMNIIALSAWWHDVGRLYKNVGHEKISAKMAYDNLVELSFDKKNCLLVYNAIVNHKWSMKPKTIEGKIIYDADKLNFISIQRWKKCLKNKEYKNLKEMYFLIPRLETEFLFLKSSKEIYKKRIKKFIFFINKMPIKYKIKLN
ncbi:MAG TPA: HD domain-containing protein [bacterium]|nr:HD domain-containing protein [bacterium]